MTTKAGLRRLLGTGIATVGTETGIAKGGEMGRGIGTEIGKTKTRKRTRIRTRTRKRGRAGEGFVFASGWLWLVFF
jgi:hypothetical protein